MMHEVMHEILLCSQRQDLYLFMHPPIASPLTSRAPVLYTRYTPRMLQVDGFDHAVRNAHYLISTDTCYDRQIRHRDASLKPSFCD